MFKRYRPFFKAGSMDMMAFKFNIFSWLIVSALQVTCLVFLWIAVYKNSTNGMDSIINGFSFKDMITYLVMINIFTFVSFDGSTSWNINQEIKDGTIAMAFVKPISYRTRFIFTNLGVVSTMILMFGIPSFTIAYIVFYFMGYIEIVSIWSFLLYLVLFLISQLIATMLNDVLNYIFGILCFYTTAGFGLNTIRQVIVNFLSGTLIPLSFFPGIFERIVSLMPFAGMAQNPVLIMLMKVSYLDALKLIGLSFIWLLILELLAWLLFNHASKKVTVQGG